MAELRLTGPTEDGDALRLLDPDGAEHALPLTPYLRRLVLEDAERAGDDDAAPASSSWYDLAEMDEAAEEDSPAGEEPSDDDDAAGPSEDAPGPARPDEELSLTPRIDPEPAPTQTPQPAADAEDDDAAPAAASPAALTDQESVKAAATQEAEPLSPREIQQRIRAGASVEQVARESGNAFSRIRTYGYPVLAERGWMAQQAQAVEVWVGGPDLYSDVVEDGGPSTLGLLAGHRLAEIGVDGSSLEWDAWRGEQGSWTVAARFSVAGLTGLPTREQPPALWSFRPAGRHLEPRNAWARVLSEAEAWDVFSRAEAGAPADAPLQSEDDEREVAADAPESVTPAGAASAGTDRDADLLEILRVRRGQRVGADMESDDALAHLIAREHADRQAREDEAPRRLAPVDAEGRLAAADEAGSGEDSPHERPAGVDADAATPAEVEAVVNRADETPETTADPAAEVSDAPEAAPADAADAADDDVPAGTPSDAAEDADDEEARKAEAPAARDRPAMPVVTPRPRARSAARRASVPSWDEIVFGRKGD